MMDFIVIGGSWKCRIADLLTAVKFHFVLHCYRYAKYSKLQYLVFWNFHIYVTIPQLCTVSAVVRVEADLSHSSDYTDTMISQWREICADATHQLRGEFDEILRPLGLQTRLVMLERADDIALCFICITLPGVVGLRDQWLSRQLRHIVERLCTFLAGGTLPFRDRPSVFVRSLTWPLTDYERSLQLFDIARSKQTVC